MTVIADEIHDLVDHAKIQAALDRQKAGVKWLQKTEADLKDAEAALMRAETESERAIHGLIAASPMEAETAIEVATRVRNVAKKMHAAAELAFRNSGKTVDAARGEAHQPVYAAGITKSLAAAKKADGANRLLNEARQDYETARSFLNFATQNNTFHIVYDPSHGKVLTTYADEVSRWSNAHPTTWWGGLK